MKKNKAIIIVTLTGLLIIFALVIVCFADENKEYADYKDKMFSMIFDLHSKEMGYDRTELICGFGNTMKERGYAIYKGKKYYPNADGIIVINTNKPR
ncbi:unnamed protein product [marine sediment metagenome]|uniref:Uncharacterized protein n=1 Tax=marine sediment metagenome TaxID=412755 RepID=X1U3Y5_9ZZZZ